MVQPHFVNIWIGLCTQHAQNGVLELTLIMSEALKKYINTIKDFSNSNTEQIQTIFKCVELVFQNSHSKPKLFNIVNLTLKIVSLKNKKRCLWPSKVDNCHLHVHVSGAFTYYTVYMILWQLLSSLQFQTFLTKLYKQKILWSHIKTWGPMFVDNQTFSGLKGLNFVGICS